MKRALVLTVTTLVAFNVSLFAAKEVFQRSKPHVNVGTIANRATMLWIHSTIILRGDGTATGQVQFRELQGEKFFYRVISAEAIIAGDEVIGLDVTLARVGDRGDETGELDELTIRRSSTADDCLIYDFVGPNVHVETEGTIKLRDPVRD
jgi:hypothetical protein